MNLFSKYARVGRLKEKKVLQNVGKAVNFVIG